MTMNATAVPSLRRPISQACTSAQFDEPPYAYWCDAIREQPRFHRKQWEFVYICQVLATRGMLAPWRRGLGFGVGSEPLVAAFAARGCEIVATDLQADVAADKGWVETNQHARGLATLNDRGICRQEIFNELVSFQFADMNNINAELRDFDFTWSACAFEHLGSISNGLRFVRNAMDTLRPGGIAVHTTEYNCESNEETLDNDGTVLFRMRDLEQLAAELRSQGHAMEITYNTGSGILDRHIDAPPYSSDKHLKLRLAEFVTTSIGIVVQKSA